MSARAAHCVGFSPLTRRAFLRTASLLPATGMTAVKGQATDTADQERLSGREARSQALRNAVNFGDQFVLWQSSYGGPDPLNCPYRNHPPDFRTCTPAARALYRLFECTGIEDYKVAADRYASFYMNVLHDVFPPSYISRSTCNGEQTVQFSAAWMYGEGLWCYNLVRSHNPNEDPFEQKAYAIYRWLQIHRRPDSYFGVGYTCGKAPDCQLSDDLAEVGIGLVSLYEVCHYQPALDDALGLAKFFLTEWEQGSGRGVWSSRLGCWLLGAWPGTGGGEHTTSQQFDSSAWGWSAYEGAHYLLRLRPHVQDGQVRANLDDKCVKAFRWCYDSCQFQDGAHGMFGCDDKWVGMTAAAILIYLELKQANILPDSVEATYRPRVERSWRWLVEHTKRDTFPPDGYIRVNGTTTKSPPANLFWGMSWTVLALLGGDEVFN